MGGGHTAATGESVANPSTPTSSSFTSTQNWNHPGITPASAAHFSDNSARLQTEIDAIVACVHDGGGSCVNDERNAFTAALSAAVDNSNVTGPETRGNPCAGWLHAYDNVLAALLRESGALFAVTESGQTGRLSHFKGEAAQLQAKQRGDAARVLAACT